MVPISSGVPNAFRIAAFMSCPPVWRLQNRGGLSDLFRPGIILGLNDPTWRGGTMRATDPSRGELGDFLRSRRERLSPESVGLRQRRRRRTTGPQARGSRRIIGRHRRRLVYPAGTGPQRQPVSDDHRRTGRGTPPGQGRACPSQGPGAERRPACLYARDRAGDDPRQPGRGAAAAGLCHGAALGCAGLERGGRFTVRLRPAGRGGAQYSTAGTGPSPRHDSSSARPGKGKRSVWWHSSA